MKREYGNRAFFGECLKLSRALADLLKPRKKNQQVAGTLIEHFSNGARDRVRQRLPVKPRPIAHLDRMKLAFAGDNWTIAQIFRHMPLKAGDDRHTGMLIGLYYLAQLLRVKLLREGSRTYHITEHHGELTAFAGVLSGLSTLDARL